MWELLWQDRKSAEKYEGRTVFPSALWALILGNGTECYPPQVRWMINWNAQLLLLRLNLIYVKSSSIGCMHKVTGGSHKSQVLRVDIFSALHNETCRSHRAGYFIAFSPPWRSQGGDAGTVGSILRATAYRWQRPLRTSIFTVSERKLIRGRHVHRKDKVLTTSVDALRLLIGIFAHCHWLTFSDD